MRNPLRFKCGNVSEQLTKVLFFCCLMLVSSSVLVGQSRESAREGGSSLKAGAEFSAFNPDYYCSTSSPFDCGDNASLEKGIGAFFDYNVRPRWGAEGEARWLRWQGVGGQVESTYLIGPRYKVYRWNSFSIWVRLLAGGGWITTAYYPQPSTLKGSFFVYAPGASIDYQLTRRFALRADYELQKWPSFAVAPTTGPGGTTVAHNHGISPNGFSVGVVYTIRGR